MLTHTLLGLAGAPLYAHGFPCAASRLGGQGPERLVTGQSPVTTTRAEAGTVLAAGWACASQTAL